MHWQWMNYSEVPRQRIINDDGFQVMFFSCVRVRVRVRVRVCELKCRYECSV